MRIRPFQPQGRPLFHYGSHDLRPTLSGVSQLEISLGRHGRGITLRVTGGSDTNGSYASHRSYRLTEDGSEAHLGWHVSFYHVHDRSAGSHYMGWPSSRRRIGHFVECVFALRHPLVLVRTSKTRQEHLPAVHWMGWFRYGGNHWRCHLCVKGFERLERLEPQ